MSSKRILVVEDETVIGIDIASKLERNGYDVVGLAVDDTEVWEHISAGLPDLILMDISLKSPIDGIDLAKAIHAKHPVPVVYLTSYSDSATIKRSMETSPYGYIIKPFTSQTLLTTISLSFIRIELEKSLRDKNELLQSILDSTLDGIAVLGDDMMINMSNASFCQILNNGSCYRGQHISALIQDFSVDSIGHTTHSVSTDSGDKIILASSCRFNQGYIVTVTDVTEMEMFKTALDQAEKRFTTIFKKKIMPAVLVTCPEALIYDVNESFMALYKPEGSVKGRHLSGLLGLEAMDQLVNSVNDNQSFNISRVVQRRGDGTEFFADLRGNRLTIDEQDYFLIDIDDISERLKIENIEKELNLQMIHTNKMTALGTLVSGVAHELNNPNNFIMFNSSLLLDYFNDIFALLDKLSKQDPEIMIGNIGYEEAKNDILQLLNGSVKGSERIRDIVLDLKGLARQDSPMNKESISMEKVIRSAVRILNHKINKSTDFFNLEVERGLPFVKGNLQKLEQVILNVLINALEALTSKSQSVTITCGTDNENVTTEVKDSGVGIPQNVLERITEPFFTTKQNMGGTGLGLSIAYTIIKDHDGTLEITSEPGKGTTVRISIPAVVSV